MSVQNIRLAMSIMNSMGHSLHDLPQVDLIPEVSNTHALGVKTPCGTRQAPCSHTEAPRVPADSRFKAYTTIVEELESIIRK